MTRKRFVLELSYLDIVLLPMVIALGTHLGNWLFWLFESIWRSMR